MNYIEQQVTLSIKKRNEFWEDHDAIPKWVDIDNVGLDQFYTKPNIANKCYKNLLNIIRNDGRSIEEYKFIEPSAGTGAFYDLLPFQDRIGIDIDPKRAEFIEHDFLSWPIKTNGKRYITVGNPPFGYRAWLALAFINHAAKFSDYVGMILPMSFQSDGKGSPKHRVKGMRLIHSECLPADSFVNSAGKDVKVNGLWQVWKRGENVAEQKKTCNYWIELFTVDQRKERLCGQNRMHEADFFLQRTFYNSPPSLVTSFSQVKYVCGYGIIIKNEYDQVLKLLNNTDWKQYSNLAAHNCRHISMYHIEKVLIDAGLVD